MDFGFWSLLPLLVALLFAFATRSAIPALLAGVIVGAFMSGGNPLMELNTIFQDALGNGEFIWVCEIVLSIGILTELFKRSGAIAGFTNRLSNLGDSPRSVGTTTWGMGLLIVDDYFSPLIVGTIMRPLSDRARMSREKLSYLLDSMTSPVAVLVPFLGYGAYLASLIVAQGNGVATPTEGLSVLIKSLPYNYYAILTLIMALGIGMKWIPDFGPMARAEKRAREHGLLLREGASPLITEDDITEGASSKPAPLWLYLGTPIALIMTIALGSFWIVDSILVAEAFMTAVAFLMIVMAIQKHFSSLSEAVGMAMSGITSVLPAILIIALAYSLNTVTSNLGAADWLIEVSEGFLTANVLVAVTFALGAIISFSTGTSWGTFALIMPLALPLAYAFSGDPGGALVLKTIAAVAGGGVFGDHASPVSDTSVLSSAGAGSDHMDHVITQIPYAVTVAVATILLYLIV